ncbi:MAG: DUF1015 domain-containing protein [Chloroflexi bacterium]|nr:DUF1015 domain-containing protein [Chloroflexota bacterium]
MPTVRPFQGLRFNLTRVGDLTSVISPPYDVISKEEQALYYGRSSYNVIRLELPLPGEGSRDDRYQQAACTLQEWLRDGILVREGRPAFYLVEHRFPYAGGTRSRWGLIARLRLEEWSQGHVRPHESILRAPAADRYELLRACRANFSPVMGIFRSRLGLPDLFAGELRREADFAATDDYGVVHNAWVVSEPQAARRASRFLSQKTVYIADGHHRYSVALAYMKERRASAQSYTGREPFNYVMMALMSAADPGLITLPTHRLVRGLGPQALSRLEEGLTADFREIERLPLLGNLSQTAQSWQSRFSGLQARGSSAFGLYIPQQNALRILVARDRESLQRTMPQEQPEAWRSLDVSLLHWVVLRGMVGISTTQLEEDCLEFTRDPVEAISRVASGEFQMAFFLNPMPLSSLFAVADAGARMPQKTTYFYPKTATGLVINPLF